MITKEQFLEEFEKRGFLDLAGELPDNVISIWLTVLHDQQKTSLENLPGTIKEFARKYEIEFYVLDRHLFGNRQVYPQDHQFYAAVRLGLPVEVVKKLTPKTMKIFNITKPHEG